MVRKGSPVRVRQRALAKGLLFGIFRGSAPCRIVGSSLSRVPSGHRSVADRVPGLANHLDRGAALGGVALLEQAPVDVQAGARLVPQLSGDLEHVEALED